MPFAAQLTVGVLVAFVTVLLAGVRFQNEEQARAERLARDEIRRMVASWSVDIGLFIEGQRDLPVIDHGEAEKYKMCSAVIEKSRPLGWLTRAAVRRAARLLFGRQILDLAELYPYEAFAGQSSFMLTLALFDRGEQGEGGSRLTENGHFGDLFINYQIAVRSGSRSIADVPKIEGNYRARHLIYILQILKEIRWYHLIVLSKPYQELKLYARRNVRSD